jgi:hypothetical protein
MAVINVAPRELKPCTATRKSGGTSYTVVYLVETDSPLDGPAVVVHSPLLPQLRTPYVLGNDSDLNSFLSELTPKLTEHTRKWEVTCKYEPPKAPDKNQVEAQNPFQEAPEVEVSFQQFTRPVESAEFLFLAGAKGPKFFLGPACSPVAKQGDWTKIQSSSGEPFVPAPQAEDHRPVIRITRNEATIPQSYALYANAINTDSFTIASAGLGWEIHPAECKMTINASRQVGLSAASDLVGTSILAGYPGIGAIGISTTLIRYIYWKVTFELSLNFEKWDIRVIDQGYRQRLCPGDPDPSGVGVLQASEVFPINQLVPPTIETADARGAYPAQPHALDGHGKLLESVPGNGKQKLPEVPPIVFSHWRIYEELPFRPLNL